MQFFLFFASSFFWCAFVFIPIPMIAVPANSTCHCHQYCSLCGKFIKYIACANNYPIHIHTPKIHRMKTNAMLAAHSHQTKHGYSLIVFWLCWADCAVCVLSLHSKQTKQDLSLFFSLDTDRNQNARDDASHNFFVIFISCCNFSKNNRQKNNKILRVYKLLCSDRHRARTTFSGNVTIETLQNSPATHCSYTHDGAWSKYTCTTQK